MNKKREVSNANWLDAAQWSRSNPSIFWKEGIDLFQLGKKCSTLEGTTHYTLHRNTLERIKAQQFALGIF